MPEHLVKTTTEKIFIHDQTFSPEICLALALASLNGTENAHGYSPLQWAYGQNYQWTDEDVATHIQLQHDHPVSEFHRPLEGRRVAEDLARQVRAENVLTRLKNSNLGNP